MTIPKDVVEIQEDTFCNCTNLREVVFEERSKLWKIGERAFSDCRSLAKVNLPGGLKRMERRAFYGCVSLRHIQLPCRLQRIRGGCFSQSGLCEIIFPASMREVGPLAFSQCQNLKNA